MSSRTVATLITALVLIVVLLLMLRSWRRRSRRDSALPSGYPQPATPSRQIASAAALYVATTPRDQPLERLNIPGLGFRARGGVSVTEQGVLLELAGSAALFIPADAVELVTHATWAIDRAVEPGGLMKLGWRLNTAAPTSVDSYFRFSDPADRTAISEAITTLTGRASGTPGSTAFGTEESEV
jgi:hypothetical protein